MSSAIDPKGNVLGSATVPTKNYNDLPQMGIPRIVPTRKERLKQAKYNYKKEVRLAKLKNKRFERICSLIEVIVIVLAVSVIAFILRNSNLEVVKSNLAVIGAIVTVTGGILVGIRKLRRKNRSDNHKSPLPKL